MAVHVDCFDLDMLGQQPGLRLYTQLSFCFENSKGLPDEAITNILDNGLARLGNWGPWITGEVVNENSDSDSSGTFSIRRSKQGLRLRQEDHRKPSKPSMAQLSEKNFPASLLGEVLYASRITIPPSSGQDHPVFEVKANFVQGGLILTIVGQHQAMDMMGQAFLTRLFSKACANQSIAEDEWRILNAVRTNSVPLLDDQSSIDDKAPVLLLGDDKTSNEPLTTVPEIPAPQPPPTCSWVFFNFSSSALRMLKDEATLSLTTGYISTDDVLTALAWKSLSKARSSRLNPATTSKFGRAVDVRRYLGWPKTYPGLMQCMSHHSRNIGELSHESLGSIAKELRVAVDPKTSKLSEDTRILATKIARTRDRSKLNFTGKFDPSTGLMLSSWAGVECYDLDFGLGLGPPEMVRRPSFVNVEGLAYLMPKCPNGDIALMLCARDDDLAQLRLDQDFMKYATYIG